MSDKGIGSKLLGLFVETDAAAKSDGEETGSGNKTAAELVAELAQQSGATAPAAARNVGTPNAPAPKFEAMAPLTAGKAADFDAIFRDAGMDADELDRVKKAEDLLKGLPAETPDVIKRQIVEASLKAFGFDVGKIVAAASNQKRALDAYVRVNEGATAKAISDAQAEIQRLNEKVLSLKGDIEKRTSTLASVSAQAQARKAQVQKVIDFFQGPAAAEAQRQSSGG